MGLSTSLPRSPNLALVVLVNMAAPGPTFHPNWDAQNPQLREAFRNLRVRKALSHGMNREEINQIVYYGLLESSGYSFGPLSPYFDPEAYQKYAWYDPQLANSLLDDAEITLEANPEDLDEELANAYVAQGVNRFSVGVQSLLDERLALLDRGHDAARGRESVRAAVASGASVSLDLIFGTPGQTEASWRAELTDAVALGADHVSIYDLTVEPRTRLDRMIRDGAYGPLDDGLSARLFDLTREALSAAGFVHYEVSSYARPGHEARHNRGYWHGLPYLGIGAAAHGLLARRRWVNVRRPAAYMDAVGQGEPEASSEHLDEPTWVWERVLTGLRDLQLGVESSTIEALESPAYDSLLERGYLERSGARVRVAHDRVPLLDSVLLELAPDVP